MYYFKNQNQLHAHFMTGVGWGGVGEKALRSPKCGLAQFHIFKINSYLLFLGFSIGHHKIPQNIS